MNSEILMSVGIVGIAICMAAFAAFCAFYVGRAKGIKQEKQVILEIIEDNTKHLTTLGVEWCDHFAAIAAIEEECHSATYSGLICYDE